MNKGYFLKWNDAKVKKVRKIVTKLKEEEKISKQKASEEHAGNNNNKNDNMRKAFFFLAKKEYYIWNQENVFGIKPMIWIKY